MDARPRSRDALLEFLDYLARKGLLNKITANARKAAASKVLALLDESEAADLTNVDLDQLMHRFSNIEGGNYTPGSLNTYKSRIKSSVEDFLNYQDSPMTFKVGGAAGARKTSDRQKGGQTTGERPAARPVASPVIAPPTSVSVLPIPIRQNLIVQIQGLPFDLTTAEANKIANVVRAMAASD
ncbi:MAG: hypothetical protein J0I79_34495 [Mesorhizobium sp.]|uniref:hypothetical protein n=1 Tax=Mesorhizobium sp. TaxID=1871066 RepID=UPI001AC44861|nr:hypothetical protein [Mesorhizobium sp.]MBN9223065.1 hypothetical protein [Mesorhizobium sp.]